MKLIDLMNAANAAYPDNCLSEFYDEATGEAKAVTVDPGSFDSLAKFVVAELTSTFEADDDTASQINAAVNVMETAASELTAVAEAIARIPDEEDTDGEAV